MKRVLIYLILSFISALSLYFCLISINFININLVKNNKIVISLFVLTIFLLLILTFILSNVKKYGVITKGIVIVLSLSLIFSVGYYILYQSNFLDKFSSVEDFRLYVSSFGSWSSIVFILLQFLQVIILPIPSIVVTGAGVLLFGPIKGAIYSVIGIIFGSITAYFIGKILGVKAVKWLVGEETLSKAINSFGKTDKILLPFMFLFPFFPDDLLCFISGLTTIKPCYFIIMVIITRSISITISSLSLNNNLIPFDTWWGILLWALVFIVTVFLTFFITSKANKISKKLSFIKE